MLYCVTHFHFALVDIAKKKGECFRKLAILTSKQMLHISSIPPALLLPSTMDGSFSRLLVMSIMKRSSFEIASLRMVPTIVALVVVAVVVVVVVVIVVVVVVVVIVSFGAILYLILAFSVILDAVTVLAVAVVVLAVLSVVVVLIVVLDDVITEYTAS